MPLGWDAPWRSLIRCFCAAIYVGRGAGRAEVVAPVQRGGNPAVRPRVVAVCRRADRAGRASEWELARGAVFAASHRRCARGA